MGPISSEALFPASHMFDDISKYVFSEAGSNSSLQNACKENKNTDIKGQNTEDSEMNEQI